MFEALQQDTSTSIINTSEIEELKLEIESLKLENNIDRELDTLNQMSISLNDLTKVKVNLETYGVTESMSSFLGEQLSIVENISTEGIKEWGAKLLEKLKILFKKIIQAFGFNKSDKAKSEKLYKKFVSKIIKNSSKLDITKVYNIKLPLNPDIISDKGKEVIGGLQAYASLLKRDDDVEKWEVVDGSQLETKATALFKTFLTKVEYVSEEVTLANIIKTATAHTNLSFWVYEILPSMLKEENEVISLLKPEQVNALKLTQSVVTHINKIARHFKVMLGRINQSMLLVLNDKKLKENKGIS